jgi:TetR/AcrR family transcriptional repressor of nem operon
MNRARAFDPTAALSQVVDLFASRGYSETSMEDIVQATGVSRYGLYGTFGNKRELFEQALEQYAEGMGKRSFLRLLEPGASLEHIRAIFDERLADMCGAEQNKGCLFVHTAMQLAPQDEELRGVLQRFMKRMSKAFAVGLDSAKGRGEVAADVDVDAAGELHH